MNVMGVVVKIRNANAGEKKFMYPKTSVSVSFQWRGLFTIIDFFKERKERLRNIS